MNFFLTLHPFLYHVCVNRNTVIEKPYEMQWEVCLDSVWDLPCHSIFEESGFQDPIWHPLTRGVCLWASTETNMLDSSLVGGWKKCIWTLSQTWACSIVSDTLNNIGMSMLAPILRELLQMTHSRACQLDNSDNVCWPSPSVDNKPHTH